MNQQAAQPLASANLPDPASTQSAQGSNIAQALGPGATATVTIYQGPAYPRLAYASTVIDLLAFYTAVFVGRTHEWQQIANFAAQRASGYLLVEAPPGYGKSALVAYLVDRHAKDQWDYGPTPTLLYYFIRQERHETTPVQFLHAINAQLLTYLGLLGGTPPDLHSLQNQFSQLWRAAIEQATAAQPLLLLVDALDESASSEATIATVLPRPLADHVHIVVTSRPNPEPLDQVDPLHPFKQATQLPLNTFSETEVQALLHEYSVAADRAIQLAPRILALTKGEPLFVRFVCQEVAAHDERALHRLEHNPPANVEAYFRDQFNRLNSQKKGDLAWNILGLLTVTLGGITRDELAEVLQAEPHEVNEALAPILRFLLGDDRLELMHLQFRKVLVAQFSPQKQTHFQDQLLAWCRHYQDRAWPEPTPLYILRHYAGHLAQTGAYPELQALLTQPWLSHKFIRTGSHRSFSADVDVAIAATTARLTPGFFVHLVRNCLIYATVGTLAANVPVELLGILAQIGESDRAAEYAALLQDTQQKGTAYTAIAQALLQQGQQAKALDYIHQTVTIAQSMASAGDRAPLLQKVIPLLVQVREFDRAIALVQSESQSASYADLLGDLACALIQMGEFALVPELIQVTTAPPILMRIANVPLEVGQVEQALDFLTTSSSTYPISFTLSELAHTVFQAGDFEQAKHLAQAVFIEPRRTEAVTKLAQTLMFMATDQVTKHIAKLTLAVTKTIPIEKDRTPILLHLILASVRLGKYNLALQAAQAIPDASDQAAALRELSQTLTQQGEQAQAQQVANLALQAAAQAITNNRDRATALSTLSQTFAQQKEWEKAQQVANLALQAAQAITDNRDRATAFSTLSQTFAQQGIYDLALQAAQAITNNRDRATAFSALSQTLTQQGEQAQVQQVANLAFQAAQAITNNRDRATALSTLSQTLAQQGIYDLALQAAQAITDNRHRATALSTLSQTFAQQKEWGKARDVISFALEAVQFIADERSKAKAIGIMARAAAAVNQSTLAAKLASLVLRATTSSSVVSDTVEVRAAIAPVLAHTGQFQASLDLLKTISTDWYKVSSLCDTARIMAMLNEKQQANRFLNQAQSAAQNIPSKPYRIQAIAKVAHTAAHIGNQGQARTLASQVQSEVKPSSPAKSTVLALGNVAQTFARIGDMAQARAAANGAWEVAQVLSPAEAKAEALSAVALAFATTNESERAIQAANAALAAAQTISSAPAKALALSYVAQAFARSNQIDAARQIASEALTTARLAGRETLFQVLSELVELLPIIDPATDLWRVFRVIEEVDGWWGHQLLDPSDQPMPPLAETQHSTKRIGPLSSIISQIQSYVHQLRQRIFSNP